MAEGVTDSEEEEEERAVVPYVTRAPKGSSRSKPQDDLTPVESKASSLADFSFHSLEGGSNEENAYDSLSSHTTPSSFTSADSQLTETKSPVPDSMTESQFSSVMPYQEDTGHTSTEVFTETSDTQPHSSQQHSNSLNTSETTHVSEVYETPPLSLCQGEVPDIQEGLLLYVLEGLLPMALGYLACLIAQCIGKP